MEKFPKISCVVAIYNVEEYLEECIRTLINQDYENVEIILVDDGSTDNCLSICNKYKEMDSRVTVITQKNCGANIARNRGMNAASGKWIFFCDGDDFVKKDIFTALVDYMNTPYDIIMFTNCVLKHGKVNDRLYPREIIEFKSEEDFYELSLATMNRFGDSKYNYKYLDAVSIWNKIYGLDFLKNNHIQFVPHFPKTQDLSFNLLVYEKAQKGIYINHVGYVYRINSGSVSRRYQPDFMDKMEIMMLWYEEFAKKHDNKRMREAYLGRKLTFMRTATVLFFCNKGNKAEYRERRKLFKKYLSGILTGDDRKISGIKGLPFKEMCLTFCIIHKNFFLCEIMNGVMYVLEKKKS